LQAHLMAGFSVESARELFGIPETHAPVTMLALGYQVDLEAIPEELRERELAPRTRKPLSEIVFSGSNNEPFFTN